MLELLMAIALTCHIGGGTKTRHLEVQLNCQKRIINCVTKELEKDVTKKEVDLLIYAKCL